MAVLAYYQKELYNGDVDMARQTGTKQSSCAGLGGLGSGWKRAGWMSGVAEDISRAAKV